MFLPLTLLILSILSAAVPAYGTASEWGSFHHGLAFIVAARRLQWPLLALSLALCVALLIVVISGRRRAWWLIGLLPVLALFTHRFLTRPDLNRQAVEDPPLVDAAAATFLSPGDYVVGALFAGKPIAFPYAALYRAPAVLLHDREQRMILLWSPAANKATAVTLGRELHARDLDVVSFPAGALLLYDGRLGAFINGITGQTQQRTKPTSFHDALAVEKTAWSDWLSANPTTRVLALPGVQKTLPGHYDQTAHPATGLDVELPATTAPTDPASRNLTVVFGSPPLAFDPNDVGEAPVNLAVGSESLLVLRDPATGKVRAFDRHLEADLTPHFARYTDPKRPTVSMVDADTNTEWTSDATAVTGPADTHGKKLVELPVETDLPWTILHYWLPEMQQVTATEIAAGVQQERAVPASQPSRSTNARRRRRRRTPTP